MNQLKIVLIFIIIFSVIQTSHAQINESDRVLQVSDEEKIILFAGFSIAVIAIFLFLARDIILRKKHNMIKKNMNQKKIEHMKNIIPIGGMIMKKLEKEEIVKKKESLEKTL